MAHLTAKEIDTALEALPGWSGDTADISVEHKFDSYEAGVAFAVQVALVAQRIDHHPDITIGWQRVKVLFTSHDAGGVTRKDVEAAKLVAGIAKSLKV